MLKTLYRKNWLVGFLLLILGVCLPASCSDEEAGGGTALQTGEKGLTLNLSVENPIVVNPMSRAVLDFDVIGNLNVVVADNQGQISEVYYCTTDGENGGTGELEKDGVIINLNGSTPYVHFVAGKIASDTQIVLVGNYHGGDQGGSLTGMLGKYISEVASLTQKADKGIPIGSILYGELKDAVDDNSHIDSHTGITKKLELRRTVAMITVAINGKGLNPDVRITPTAVRLCNVPTSCTIGKENSFDDLNPGKISNYFSTVGEEKEAAELGLMPIGKETQRESTGKHFENNDYTNNEIAALFLFENVHRDNFGATDDVKENGSGKRPAGVNNTPADIEKANKTKISSYLEVDAYYEYVPLQGSPIAGEVKFRLFLGGNVISDFSVRKNTYYKVTLNLNGLVVTEDGHTNKDGTLELSDDNLSWRIETDLSDKIIISTGDVNINASGDFFYIDMIGSETVQWKLSATCPDMFLWAYGKVGSSQNQWGSLVSVDVSGTGIPKGGIMIYAQPWDVDVNWKNIVRTGTIALEYSEDGGTTWKEADKITVNQYAPITFNIPANKDDLPEGLKELAGHKMFIDRVDRKAMPWGFYGRPFSETHGVNAFYNMYNLVSDEFKHLEFAQANYSPWGWHKDTKHDYSNGSAMIYALGLNLYPDSTPDSTDPNWASPEGIENRTAFPTAKELEDRYEYSNKYLWTIPTIAGWQVIEKYAKAEIEASGDLKPKPYDRYWTSNAITQKDTTFPEDERGNGDKMAYYYCYGANFDKITTADKYKYAVNRNVSLKFRCVGMSKATN